MDALLPEWFTLGDALSFGFLLLLVGFTTGFGLGLKLMGGFD